MILGKLKKRLHYKDKIYVMYKKVWDLEFLKEKFKAMREGFRIEYDRIKEIDDAAKLKYEELKRQDRNEENQKIIDSMKRMREKNKPDIKQLEEQMASIDQQIEGQDGVDEKIDSYRTVIALLKEHKKKL